MARLPSGLPEAVDDGEDIARFLTQRKGQFKSDRVLPPAFLPSPNGRETSVARHGREPRDTLCALGLVAAGERRLYGAAILKAGDVRAVPLEVSSAEPPERHAVIRGWPWVENDRRTEKAQQLEKAVELASAAGAPLLFNEGEPWTSE